MKKIYFYPCDEAFPISQPFGVNPASYKAFGLAGHNGLDIALPVGQEVRPLAAGWVRRAEESRSGYGRHVRLVHPDGAISIYAHLSQFNVQVDQAVDPDTVLGLSGGDTSDPYAGNSTGPHLHLELRPQSGGLPGYGGAVDPLPLLCSRDYQPDRPAMYQVQVLAERLNLRLQPNLQARVMQSALKNQEFSVVEEVEENDCLWLRLHTPLTRYLCARQGGRWYVRRLMVYSTYPPMVPWPDAVTAFLRGLGYTGPDPQSSR